MRTSLECYPCLIRQALDVARMAGADNDQQSRIIEKTLAELRSFDRTRSPPEMANWIHRLVRRETGCSDPYADVKRDSTEQALALYPQLKRIVADAADPLETAVRLSIAGNIIDFGVPSLEFDLNGTIDRILTEPFAIDDFGKLRTAMETADDFVVLADNAGETVFDRVLIETVGKPLTYVVKSGPILNDATKEDALAAGLGEVATIVDNGADAPGTILSQCSQEFSALLDEARLVIAKGQANFETLGDSGSSAFFLFQAKCPIVARELGTSIGASIVMRGGG